MSRESIIRLECNHCVTAGAGAGKTTCLVDAYLGLIGGNGQRAALAPDQVVAITFTEKAAAEMRSRVAMEAAKRAADHGGRWREVLPALEWAPITTIHSFCATVLRDHGTVLGIDPDFAIMDGDAFGLLLDEAIEGLLRRGLSAQNKDLMLLMQHYPLSGKWGVSGMLAAAYHGLGTMGIGASLANEATGLAHGQTLSDAHAVAAELAAMGDTLAAAVNDQRAELEKSKAAFAPILLGFAAKWPGLRARLSADPLDSSNALAIDAAMGPNRGGKGEIPGLRKAAKSAAQSLAQAAALPDAARLSNALLNLLEALEADLAREKARRSALGFDDLLLKSLELLEGHPDILAGLRRRFRAVMVDEFQDVNPVQGRFVRLLCGLTENQPGGADVNPLLLLVGDRKQSIYAFRGADVRFFAQTIESFENGGWGSLVALQRNFRSNPQLISFFNRVFEAVFGQGGDNGGGCRVQFRPDDQQRPGRDEYPETAGAAVEVLDCSELAGEKDSAAVWRGVEADAVAAHIAAMIADGHARPGEVAILLRRMTQVALYEQALAKAGVSFNTVRGRGFYQCQEIGDMALALRALLRPYDDLAATAFLRSPLVGLSDESLLALAHGEPGGQQSMSQALRGDGCLPAWCGGVQNQRLTGARELVARLSPWAPRMSPADLLTELAAATDYEAILSAIDPAGQKAANLRKLIENARSFEGGSAGYLRDLEQKLARDVMDAQAPPAAGLGNEVQIMTIHQAKGLQFPVVMLCDLGAGRGQADSMPPPGEGGVISLKPVDFSTGERLSNPLFDELAQRRKESEDAEAARLFYVACTRAERKLTLSITGAKRQGAWGKWARDIIYDDKAVEVIAARSISPNRDNVVNRMPECIPVDPGEFSQEGRAIVQHCLSPAAITPVLVRTSVSGMEDWLECPRRFVFTQRLGLDTALLPGGLAHAGGQDVQRAVMLGSLVHMAMESVDMGHGKDGASAALEQAAEALGAPDDVKADAASALDEFFKLPLSGQLQGLPSSALLREQPFMLSMEDGGAILELIGEIDLVAPQADGSWLIADYKVGRKLEPAKYRNQMLLYATAWWRMTGRRDVPRCVLVHLGPGHGALHEMNFSSAELADMEARLFDAAAGIRVLGGSANPADAPIAPGCRREKCPLGLLCPEDG